jgi:hypothetical protein
MPGFGAPTRGDGKRMMMNFLEPDPQNRAMLCRLCGGPTSLNFTERVLNKYSAGYWRCLDCGSMQTDPPHWLAEAYATTRLMTDTGMVSRSIQMAQMTSLLLKIAGVAGQTLCLDWGGGNGLFCRMMRDQGYNFFNDDKYAKPFYCDGFTAERVGIAKCDILTSFEVFEHLANPAVELADILRFDPRLWIFSTQLYENQAREWNYFGPQNGQHVFFYSADGLRKFAEGHGYRFVRGRHLHLFVKQSANPYFASRISRNGARKILAGGKLAGFAAGLHFLARQRHAFRHWQSDRELLKQGPKLEALRPGRR